ncbi:MAG: DEAD/DEAH box helicase family protein [Oscillospiraceae bacterium]|nr:DEAD/DEAH box helicase family protein [Oscillospiraceae bacterium]
MTKLDFPLVVSLTLADRLYVEKAGLSQNALNRIKRLAAFRNPDFYKSQAMRLPIYNKPRVVNCGEETEDYLILPRGCLSTVCELLDRLGVPFTCSDLRNSGREITVQFRGLLRPEQAPAADALLAHDIGVLSATTAFGKTVIGAYLISKRKTNTLILVHSTALLAQWKQALERFLTIDEMLPEEPKKRGRKKKRQLIGQLGGGKNNLSGIVDVAIIQSLFEDEDKHVKELVADYGMVICDECHHVAAFSFEKVLNAVRAKYVYGLSATPTRQDGHHPIIFMQCGPMRYLVDAKQQAQQRSFSHFLIPRLTKTRLPDAQSIQDVYTAIVKNGLRNAQIVHDAISVVEDGRTPIILTERKEHAEALYAVLQTSAAHVFLLLGSDSAKQKREKLDALQVVPENETLLIVATGKYVGEGFDEPRLDTLFLAMPFSWKGTLAQYVGRLHRNYVGKHEVRVYDYVDVHVPMLERMYQRRLKGYSELGYQTLSDDKESTPGMIYTGETYGDVFGKDMLYAGREIVISAPILTKSRIQASLGMIPGDVKLRVITRDLEGYSVEQQARMLAAVKLLEEAGAEIITQPKLIQRYAVIDDSIVWYGDINFLSAAKAEDTAIRLESPELAGELQDLEGGAE